MGTVMCHQAHRADTNPLADVGLKDELFKVIGFCTGEPWDAMGFAHGDRCHAL